MVQTLDGNWWLWLVPLFLVCVVVIVLASRSELGMSRRKKQTAAKSTPESPVPAAVPVETAAEEPDPIDEILVLAAAAYITSENKRGGKNMRNLKITVNGKTYDVTVEEEGRENGYAPRFTAPRAASPAAPKAAPAPAAATAPAAPAAPAPVKAASADGVRVEAPMSGRVVEIVAKPGTAVKTGDVILIMEAMKLQSEVCADCDGTVAQICVSEKQDVVTGELLAVLN